MIIVDTSIWIEYLKQNRTFVDDVNILLKSRFILAFEPIFAELLYGVRTENEKKVVLNFWNVLPKSENTKNRMIEAANYANIQNYHSKGVGLIDSMIISEAMNSNFKIWTLDKKILKILPEKFLYKTQSYE